MSADPQAAGGNGTRPMRFAYADPPYLGLCGKYEHYHGDDGLCWDELDTHRALLERLGAEFPDGWAMSLGTKQLRSILSICPEDVRVAAWGDGLPYSTMHLDDICAMPVASLAAKSAHLWLWTTHGFLWDAPRVALSWGFRPSYLLTWAKPGIGMGGRFRHSTEYLLFCERGAQLPIQNVRNLGTWFGWSAGPHSVKPPAFYDLVEQVSPGPHVELFSRNPRLGWDAWGFGYESEAS